MKIPLNRERSKLVKESLSRPDIHQQWRGAYRTAENEEFFENAFDYITAILNVPKDSVFLDAGCGSCAQSIRLAKRGFLVQAVDFSESILEVARTQVKAKGLENRISIQQEDILALSFGDNSFNYILCWGVLMHIPDLERAISELSRVLKPKGILVISEGNSRSLQSIILRKAEPFLRKKNRVVKETAAGIEYWNIGPLGVLLTRYTEIGWLMDRFKHNQFIVKKRLAGEFTDVYVKVSFPLLKSLIRAFNNLWFKYIKSPYLAFGNILILQKKK